MRLKIYAGKRTFSEVAWRLGSDATADGASSARKSSGNFFYAFFGFDLAFLDFDPALWVSCATACSSLSVKSFSWRIENDGGGKGSYSSVYRQREGMRPDITTKGDAYLADVDELVQHFEHKKVPAL